MSLHESHIPVVVHQGPHVDQGLLSGRPLRVFIDPFNPDFIGPGSEPPIQDARESLLLTAPDLAEVLHRDDLGVADALEAFQREAAPDQELDLPALDPIRVLRGARWMRNHTEGKSALHDFAVRTLGEARRQIL